MRLPTDSYIQANCSDFVNKFVITREENLSEIKQSKNKDNCHQVTALYQEIIETVAFVLINPTRVFSDF